MLTLTSCGPGRDYQTPETKATPAWHEPAAAGAVALPTWWKSFADPRLDRLVEQSLARNLDLALAAARIQEARARRGAVSWVRYPEFDAYAAAERRRGSENLAFAQPGPNNTFELGFDAAWEVDLFGGLSRAIEREDARLEALAFARGEVLSTVAAETTRAYLDLVAAQELVAVAREDLAGQQRIRDLVAARVGAGATTESELAQADAELAAQSAAIPDLDVRRSEALARLAVLAARPAGEVFAATAGETGDDAFTGLATLMRIPQPASMFAAGLPSDLVWRRPDLRRAERELAAATADIGVIESDLYPRFSLTGSFGLESDSTDNLTDHGSRFWSIGPSVRWPLLAQGRIRRQARAADTRAVQAGIIYEQAVLIAFADVEFALASLARAQERVRASDASADAHVRALKLVQVRYEHGAERLLAVLIQSHNAALARRQAIEARRTMALSVVGLAKALGGGWQPTGSTPPTEPVIAPAPVAADRG
ncbi:MAG: efflux transporter outer membrane subunit [Planctomycetes bacterium]|nr:efflux transporter outer membrane subunit [Planctomycetota bacterium]